MEYTCSVCHQKVQGELLVFKDHTEKHIVDLIKHDHPQWVESDGICAKCMEYYSAEIHGSTFKDAACAVRQRKVKSLWATLTGIFKK